MTDGRFETVYNLRPGGWDTRRHWTKTHAPFAADPFHIQDHMDRESCPFHDLRAEGAFQPEYGGLGVEGSRLTPGELVKRKAGFRFSAGSAGTQPRSRGIGGLRIPQDIDPPPAIPRATRSERPWTSTGKSTGQFSTFEHMSAATRPQPKAAVPKFFHTGKAALIGAPTAHYPQPFQDPGPKARPAFRLRAGAVKPNPAPPPMPLAAVDPPKKKKEAPPRPPYVVNSTHKGTLSRFPAHAGEPWAPGGVQLKRYPIFTYAAKTKRSMPIGAPWHTGPESAEPHRATGDALDTAAGNAMDASFRGRARSAEPSLLRNGL